MAVHEHPRRARPAPPLAEVERGEQRFVVRGVSWKDYLILREALEIPGLRMTYDRGALELMSPSREHEVRKKFIARLVELFAVERDVPLDGYGSTTFRREIHEQGLEPDECYVYGGPLREFPDIALEVVVTGGGLEKLPIYRNLGVREVWFFQDGAFKLYALRESGYEPIARSELIPTLDFEVIARFALRNDQHQALREFRELIRLG